MVAVTHSSQMTQSGVTGTGEWDSRLDGLLEELQNSVIPTTDTSRNAQEYREYRLTTSSQINNEPPQTSDEKWVEIGNLVGGGPISSSGSTHHHHHQHNSSLLDSSSFRSEQKSVAFADQPGILNSNRILSVQPSNTYTSIIPSSTSPKIERKEFYSKQSYTSMIKGTGGDVVDLPNFTTEEYPRKQTTEDFTPFVHSRPSITTEGYNSSSSYETRKNFMTSSSSTDRQSNNTQYRSVSPPPMKIEPLKTPPMLRKMLQSSQKDICSHTNTSASTYASKPPPTGGVPLPIIQSSSSTETHRTSFKKPQEEERDYSSLENRSAQAKYFTSTVTTEHRQKRDLSPIRQFPSAQPPKGAPEQPKLLDELLATFGETYSSSQSQKSTSYPVQRSVRIDENSELIQRKNVSSYQNPAYNKRLDDEPKSYIEPSRNVQGPPVFYPPGEMFSKTEEESMKQMEDRAKGKMKMERSLKEKEKMKSKHSEKGGQGAMPVPVCLPVCCAAPCVIM